ncbi:MAG TPA: hypothetical protein VGK54_03750 [Chloroflexota bacterium]
MIGPTSYRLVAAAVLLLVSTACSGVAATPSDNPSAATMEALTSELNRAQSTLAVVSSAAAEIVAAQFEPAAVDDPATPEPEPTARAPFPTRTPRPLTAADAAPCQIGQIKGNRSSKIYHVPGGGSYAQTKASVQCFDTEAAAQAAGFRRALN